MSLASTDEARQRALPMLLDGYDVAVPDVVLEEIDAIAQYDDVHGTAVQAVREERD